MCASADTHVEMLWKETRISVSLCTGKKNDWLCHSFFSGILERDAGCSPHNPLIPTSGLSIGKFKASYDDFWSFKDESRRIHGSVANDFRRLH